MWVKHQPVLAMGLRRGSVEMGLRRSEMKRHTKASYDAGQFLELVRSNPDMGNDYIENDLLLPTTEEIKDARPLAMVLPKDVLNHAALIAATICAGTQANRGIS
jgi:hypothetical protein